MPAHFAPDAEVGAPRPSLIRLAGVGLLGLALSIAAGAFLYGQDDSQIEVEPLAVEVEPAELPPVTDVPPLEEAPDEIVVDVGGADSAKASAAGVERRRTIRERASTRGGRSPSKKASTKKKAPAKKKASAKKPAAEAEPPPGFLDFDVN